MTNEKNHFHFIQHCSKNNKNTETDIGVQPEDQKSKAAKMAIVPPGILRMTQTELRPAPPVL